MIFRMINICVMLLYASKTPEIPETSERYSRKEKHARIPLLN